MSDPFFEMTEARRKALEPLIVPAIKATEADVAALAKGKKVWGGHHGAIGIHPKHLYVYFVLPKRRDVADLKRLADWPKIQVVLKLRMSAAGYPVDALQGDWLGLYSEEECQDQAHGNWYAFFK